MMREEAVSTFLNILRLVSTNGLTEASLLHSQILCINGKANIGCHIEVLAEVAQTSFTHPQWCGARDVTVDPQKIYDKSGH